MKKQYIQIVVGVLVLLGLVAFIPFKPSQDVTKNEVTGNGSLDGKESPVSGSKPASNTGTGSTYVPANKEFPFSFNEKNLIVGSPFGSFKYSGSSYGNQYNFSGGATISGQVTLVDSDGSHNLGLIVDKADMYKLPQYYLESVKSADGSTTYTRSSGPYTICFGFYHPYQYNWNGLLDKLSAFAGKKVTVEIDNYKILTSSEHVGPCASLIKINN
jgi:hypothetical protein